MPLANVTSLNPLQITLSGSTTPIPVWKVYDSVVGLVLDDLVVATRVNGRYVIEGRLI